jgi:ribosomal protein S18 acetylase RimI-like enzyme
LALPVSHTEKTDIDTIFWLFDESVKYQEKHSYPNWRNYDKEAIRRDIEALRQYKVVADGKIAIVFSVAYSDRVIWRHMDQGKSIYLHRIVVNPAFKGQRLFNDILEWAVDHCKAKGFESVRMDTWADNPRIIEYYKGFGFEPVEQYTTPDTEELPEHNRRLSLQLLEYRLT